MGTISCISLVQYPCVREWDEREMWAIDQLFGWLIITSWFNESLFPLYTYANAYFNVQIYQAQR